MTTDAALRAEHDQVLAGLSTRDSTRHFAHAAVSYFIAIVLGGTAGKLAWDFWDLHPEAAVFVAALTVIALGYGSLRLVTGRRRYAAEKGQIARLLELRARLGVDAPATTSVK